MTLKSSVDFRYHPDKLPVNQLFLVGSWNQHGSFDPNWSATGTPMERTADGSFTAQLQLEGDPEETFFWGVRDQQEHWMLFENEAATFQLSDDSEQSFELGFRNKLGLQQKGKDGFKIGVWAPNAKEVRLLLKHQGRRQSLALKAEGDFWFLESSWGWHQFQGYAYAFEFLTSCGQSILRADPYAYRRQGSQRGVSDLFVNASGRVTHRYEQDKAGHHLLRFEAVPSGERLLDSAPFLRLFRDGKQLNKTDLKKLVLKSVSLPERETWWSSRVSPDGSIELKKKSDCEAYSVCLGSEASLRGLEYLILDRDGQSYHDPWNNVLDGHHNWSRWGIFGPQERRDPKQKRASFDTTDLIIYELHIGSVLGQGDNLRCSHLKDVESILPKIKDLGFNTIALMPTNATEGWRDWGYLGTSSFAHHEAYAEPDSHVQKSLIEFIDRAHKLKLRVFCDVVYNHVGGFHNDLWNFDGLENSWFERQAHYKPQKETLTYRPIDLNDEKEKDKEQKTESSVRETPWGAIPAFNKRPVSQFFIDHAMDQIERFQFDGIRFDFTNLIHAQGAGGTEGWKLLQGINQRLKHFYPQAITFAEEFPPHPIITTAVEDGGAGFHGMWNTEHQHRLVFNNHGPSICQNLAEDSTPPLDHFLAHLLHPHGFSEPHNSATVLSNHDEVGNAQRLKNIVKTHAKGTDIARLVSWFSLLCPGYPILFQGTEDLAQNYFSWGLPHTWDGASHFSTNDICRERLQHRDGVKDVLKLRQAHPGLWSSVPITEHFLDRDKSLLGIRRDKYWIVGNFGPKTQPSPKQTFLKCKLILNSENKKYGYLGTPGRGGRVGGYALKIWEQNS